MQDRAENTTADFDERMGRLRTRYLETLKDVLLPIEAALRHCEDDTLTDAVRLEVRTLAHRLAGTGETYGFAVISHVSRPLDIQLRQQPDLAAPALMALIYPLVVACRNVLGRDEIRGVRPPRTQFGLRRTPVVPGELANDPVDAPIRLPLMLVVDDDPAMRELFIDLFSDEARIVTATNSDEALIMMRHHHPDLVLLDDIMPGAITGLKFLETLQKSGEFSGTPIIMITASDAPEHIERGLNAGAVDYITKPFNPEAAALKIRRFLPATSLS